MRWALADAVLPVPDRRMSLSSLVPLASVKSVSRSIEFYQKLGFVVGDMHTSEGAAEPTWAWLTCGGAQLMFGQASGAVDSNEPAVIFYLYCDDVAAFRAAGLTAAAFGADALMMLSNVPGLLRAFPDESTLIAHVRRDAIGQAAEAAQGRMKKKVLGAQEALDGGVKRVIFGDARKPEPIRRALAGAGTVFE